MAVEKARLSHLQRRIVLLLFKHGPLARAELAERVGMSRSRLSPEVSELISHGFVRQDAAPVSTGGRRGAVLHLGGPEFGVLCGVNIDADRVSVAFTHLDGSVLAKWRLDSDSAAAPAETLGELSESIEAAAAGSGVSVRAVGVSIAADVDRWGQLSDPPPTMPRWGGVAVGEHFAKRHLVPCFVENDVNVLAIAEGSHGARASEHETYAVVKVSSGVGCGIVVNGTQVRGEGGHAGDIGHICIDPANETLCACGNKGCLEAVVSTPALIREASRLASTGQSDALARLADRLSLEAISEAAQADDPATIAMLRSAGRHVGFVLASLVAVLNPGAVFVSTGISGAEDLLLSSIRERVYERARPAATRGLQVLPSRFVGDDEAVGAAILAGRGLVSSK